MVIGAVQQVIRTILVRHNSKDTAHKTSLFPAGTLSIVQEIIDLKLPPTYGRGLSAARLGEPNANKDIKF
jgi:hypothetical protein